MRKALIAVLPTPTGPRLSATPPTPDAARKRTLSVSTRGALVAAAVVYNWLLWAFFTLLLFGQTLGLAWTRVETSVHLSFGQHPALGVYDAVGTNDLPFSDRSFVCSLRGGRVYRPVQLQNALESPLALVVDTSGRAIDGFRVISRKQLDRFDRSVLTAYANTCNVIAETINGIFARCEDLGYNVSRAASLRIVTSSGTSSVTTLLPQTLPVVAMPFSDRSFYGRYAVPGRDGSACMIRLVGAYEGQGVGATMLRAVNRTVREQRTSELLRRPGGVWRNGWYEDRDGEQWFSDVISSINSSLGVAMREFDMLRGTENDCSAPSGCETTSRTSSWGTQLTLSETAVEYTSVAILSPKHLGLFYLDAPTQRTIESVYKLDAMLSNVSLGSLLVQWLVALVALLNSYRFGVSELQAAGIGVLSCARGFHWLPVFLLPRLKTNLAVFATIGCSFEGSQLALSQAWFVMYPGIAELVFFVFSLLNLVAKLLRRRMSDALFGPTLLFFCVLHYFRMYLAQSDWLEFDGRVNTLVTSEQVEHLSLIDFFRHDTLLKLNGNVQSIFVTKLVVLALNLVPLLASHATTASASALTTEAELTLALRLHSSGGLGLAPTLTFARLPRLPKQPVERVRSARPLLSSYDLLRLGYVVVGDSHVVTMADWLILAACSPRPLRRIATLRVMVFAAQFDALRGCYVVGKKPQLLRVSDKRLASCSPWAISTRAFK